MVFFDISCSFTFVFSGEKNISPNLTNIREPEPHVIGPLEPEPLGEKEGAEAAWKKSQKPKPQKN